MNHSPLMPSSVDRKTDLTALPAHPYYKWLVVGMLWFICFFNYADRQAISAVLKLLESEFHFNKEQQGQIVSAFAIVYALSAPLAGQVGDRFGRKMIILGGLYVWSIITALTAVCSRFWHFILVRGAEGLGETFYFPASMSLLSDYHDRSTRSRALSLHQTSVYAGTIAGSWLAGWMGQMFGWRLPFIVFGMGGVLLGLVLAMYIREPQRDEAERRLRAATDDTTSHPPMPWLQLLAEMARTPTVLALVLAFGGANFVALIFLGWAPTFLNEKFGMTLAEAGLKATLFIQVGSMVGSAAGGALADWARRYWPGGRISVQAVGLLLGAPFVYLSGESAQFALAAVAMSLFGFCKGLYDSNIWASLFDVIPPLRRGSVVGLMNLFGWLFGAAGPMVVGRAVDRGMTMSEAIASTGAIYLGASILLILAAILCAPRDIQRMQQGAARV